MKFLKTFESFDDTGVDDGAGEVLPSYNPVKDLEIKKFVDESNIQQLSQILGKKINHHLSQEKEDKLKEIAFNFLKKNPEMMPSHPLMKTYKVPGGDRIVRTNKVGGTIPT
jgi:hypothetical protein